MASNVQEAERTTPTTSNLNDLSPTNHANLTPTGGARINTLLQPVRDSDMEVTISSVNAFETNSMLQGPIQDGITHTGTQDAQLFCWHDAGIKTLARAVRESWTEQDIKSAFLQLNLLSYSDVLDASDTSLSSVDFLDYKHNCPWNDWIPPSKSVLRQAPTHAIIHQRVRVRLCASPDLPSGLIAFVSVETEHSGAACLRIRRGADILMTVSVCSLNAQLVGPLLVRLSPRPPMSDQNDSTTPVSSHLALVYLHFDSNERLTRFLALL
jgi:hypothetical protein